MSNDETAPPDPGAATAPLEGDDQKELLRIARTTLKQWLMTGHTPPGAPHRPTLLAPRAAFVSVHVDGQLRGCIGRLDADSPLYKTIVDLTVSAATRDARFDPVRLEEVKAAKIEISLLSPREPLVDPSRIEVGRHGLVVTRGPRRGLLLPKVAAEQGWDRETFLAETCRKAGLDVDAWRDPETTVETFTAQVFAEG